MALEYIFNTFDNRHNMCDINCLGMIRFRLETGDGSPGGPGPKPQPDMCSHYEEEWQPIGIEGAEC